MQFRPRWKAEHRQFIQKLKENEAVIPEIVTAGLLAIDGQKTPEIQVNDDIVVNGLKAKLTELSAKYKASLNIIEEQQKTIEVVDALKSPIKPFDIIASKSIKDSDQACAICVLNDWHVGEYVDADVVYGFNEYTPEIVECRVAHIPVNLIKLVDKERSKVKIETLVLAILGDMITGYLHDEQIESNTMSPIEETLFAKRLLISVIDYILKNGNFKQILIPCVRGNHGRTTKRIQHSTGWRMSYEWLLYQELAGYYEKEKRIQFIIEKSAATYLPVYDYVLRFHHGDAFKYIDGVGGIAIGANKWLSKIQRQKFADFTFIGHWHQRWSTASLRVCKDLMGMNAYAANLGADANDPPSQTFCLLNKSRNYGLTAFHQISVV